MLIDVRPSGGGPCRASRTTSSSARWGSPTTAPTTSPTPPARLGIAARQVVVKVIAGPTSDDAFRRATRELKHFSVADSDRLVDGLRRRPPRRRVLLRDGVPPARLAREPGRTLDAGARRRAVRDAALAAHALHERGIAHRDIKPANILSPTTAAGSPTSASRSCSRRAW